MLLKQKNIVLNNKLLYVCSVLQTHKIIIFSFKTSTFFFHYCRTPPRWNWSRWAKCSALVCSLFYRNFYRFSAENSSCSCCRRSCGAATIYCSRRSSTTLAIMFVLRISDISSVLSMMTSSRCTNDDYEDQVAQTCDKNRRRQPRMVSPIREILLLEKVKFFLLRS